MADIDYIAIEPDSFGWRLRIEIAPDTEREGGTVYYGIGDAAQFHAETERTIGRWLADGPADFHSETDNQKRARAILRERIEQVQTNLDRERAEVDRILREAIDLKEDTNHGR